MGDWGNYSRRQMKSIFMKYGKIEIVKMGLNTCTIVFSKYQSCIMACSDKELIEDFGFYLNFFGFNDKKNHTLKNSWKKIRVGNIFPFSKYERIIINIFE